MTRLETRARLGALLATFSGIVAASAASPIFIDSEAKADAAVVTAFRVADEAPQDFNAIASESRLVVENALQFLRAHTTPSALLANRSGKRIPCPISGTLTAKLSRNLPRVLDIDWNRCHFEDSLSHTYIGRTEVTLVTDSFTPTRVAGIRHGAGKKALVDEVLILNTSQVVPDEHTFNLSLFGDIPMLRMFGTGGPFVGSYAFETDGVFHEMANVLLPGEGETLFQVTSDWIFERARFAGSRVGGEATLKDDDDFTLRSGRFTFVHTFPAFSTQPEQVSMRRYSGNELRVHRVTAFGTGAEQLSIDGRANYLWSQDSGLGCRSGTYAFATNVPMNRPNSSEPRLDSGEILVNDAALATFSIATGFPFPFTIQHIRVAVANVGTFDYDGLTVTDTLGPVAVCP